MLNMIFIIFTLVTLKMTSSVYSENAREDSSLRFQGEKLNQEIVTAWR